MAEDKIKYDDFAEIGTGGLRRTGGFIIEEFLTGLRSLQGAKAYKEMSTNDPVVGALLFAIEQLIRNIDWRVDPFTGSEEEEQTQADKDLAEFVEQCRHDMSSSWDTMISDILSMLVYGYAFCEIVYKKRMGNDQDDPSRRSQFRDNKIGWRKITLRAQETTWMWMLDEKGGIQGMVQVDPSTGGRGAVEIPIEKALLFRTSSSRNNPEGRSLLRNAYRPWRFKKTIEEIEAVGIERDLAGLPVAYVPPQLLSGNANEAMVGARDAIQELVRGIKRNENEGILFPLSYDENGREMYKLTLLTTGGQRQFDTDKVVSRYDQRIAMTVLADFILLGHENVGSFALGASKIDLFTTAISQIAREICEVFNSYAIPRLLKLNGIKTDRMPKLAFGQLTHVDLALLGNFIQQVAGAGALVVDAGLDEYLRTTAGLPPREEDDGIMPVGDNQAKVGSGDDTGDKEDGDAAPKKPQADNKETASPTPKDKKIEEAIKSLMEKYGDQ
jgi:hypothetical protein